MDVLTNKAYKTYDSLSRYTVFPYYYNSEDDKYIYGVTGQLNTNVAVIAHKVSNRDTLDSIALKYYGRPDYWWVIADFNRIQDPYINLSENFKILNIPSISNISFKKV